MNYLRYHISDEIIAFSTCRSGGVSKGNYASFNCTHYCGDEPEHVLANRSRLCGEWNIPADRLVLPRQVHDTKVVVVDDLFMSKTLIQRDEILDGVDALISPLPNVCLAISTADCIPVLLYDTKLRVVGAIHAGWRGTVARIVSDVLAQMKILYGTQGEDVRAVIGPGISLDAFEVGDEVYDSFCKAGFPMEQISRRYEKWHIDLWEANRLQLLEGGLLPNAIEVAGICTYQHFERFFSARRLGIHSGRILTAIMRRN